MEMRHDEKRPFFGLGSLTICRGSGKVSEGSGTETVKRTDKRTKLGLYILPSSLNYSEPYFDELVDLAPLSIHVLFASLLFRPLSACGFPGGSWFPSN